MTDGDRVWMFDYRVRLDTRCKHCGDYLVVLGERFTGLTVSGLRDLVYEHSTNGKPTCELTFNAEPFDHWQATRDFEEKVNE